jgi:hypothetical protein
MRTTVIFAPLTGEGRFFPSYALPRGATTVPRVPASDWAIELLPE